MFNLLRKLRAFFKLQEEVAEQGSIWSMALVKPVLQQGSDDDSQTFLKRLGFRIIGVSKDNQLFFDAQPPIGWTRRREKNCDSVFIDTEGRERIRQHYYESQNGACGISLTELAY